MKTFVIEAIVLCLTFHFCIYLVIRFKPELEIYSYPPAITQRWIDLGKVQAKEIPSLRVRLTRKIPAAVLLAFLLGLLLWKINGCTDFLSAFLTGYGLWLIVDWYDALVLDCLWFCHSPTCILPGTEDMTGAYHDYGFHLKSSVIGMLIGLPACFFAALAVKLFTLFF